MSEDVELSFLEAGADDYIRKSRRLKSAVLVGRIQAVLRRTRPSGPEVIQTEHLTMHPGRREALVDGQTLKLTPTEFDILYKLATNPDRALSRRELLDRGRQGRRGRRPDRRRPRPVDPAQAGLEGLAGLDGLGRGLPAGGAPEA